MAAGAESCGARVLRGAAFTQLESMKTICKGCNDDAESCGARVLRGAAFSEEGPLCCGERDAQLRKLQTMCREGKGEESCGTRVLRGAASDAWGRLGCGERAGMCTRKTKHVMHVGVESGVARESAAV
jgi:hypothetical protein